MGAAASACDPLPLQRAPAPRLRSTLVLTAVRDQVSPSLSPSSSPSLPSHAVLKDVMLQAVCSQELRRYVLSLWRPGTGQAQGDSAYTSSSDDTYFQSEGKTIAVNVIDFCREATDFTQIPKCGFQYYRACHIYEKFLMRGASHHVPLSAALADECLSTLYGGRSGDSSCSSGIFASSVAEALDFLLAEVCLGFQEDVHLQSSVQELSSQTREAIIALPEFSHDVASSGLIHDALATVLRDDICFNSALEFASNNSHPDLAVLLHAYSEVQRVTERIDSLQEGGAEKEDDASELSMVAFLHHVHRYYTTRLLHLHASAEEQLHTLKLSDATKGDFLLRLAKCTSVSSDVLQPIEMDVMQQLRQRFLPVFLESVEHGALIQEGHILLLNELTATSDSRLSTAVANSSPIWSDDLQRQHTRHRDLTCQTSPCVKDKCNEISISTEVTSRRNELSHSESDRIVQEHEEFSGPCREIISLISSCHDDIFGQYLDSLYDELHLMRFCQSVLRYQQTTTPSRALTECTNIFERYLSRNAAEQLKLPEQLMRNISKYMFNPDEFIFSEALHFVLRYLVLRRWSAFKDGISFLINEDQTLRYHPFSNPTFHARSSSNGSRRPKSGIQEETSMSLESLAAAAYAVVNNPLISRNVPFQSQARSQTKDSLSMDKKLVAEKNMQRHRSEEYSLNDDDPSSRKSSIILRKDGKKYTDGIQFEDVMSRSQCLTIFKKFLDAEGTSQTLLFLIEVDEFLKIPEIGFQQSRAKKIYFKYIHSKAIMAVPITNETRRLVEQEFLSDEIPTLIFTNCIQEVKCFVENNQFPRFMQSKEAKKVSSVITEEKVTATSICVSEEDIYIPYFNRRPSSQDSWEVKILENVTEFKTLLSNPTAVRFFKDYCVRSLCNENLFFWLDADNYSKLPGSDFRKRVGLKLYNKYIGDEAKLQVNISGKIRANIESQLSSAGRHVFRDAQDEVFNLMKRGTFPMFLRSKEYEQLRHYVEASQSSM